MTGSKGHLDPEAGDVDVLSTESGKKDRTTTTKSSASRAGAAAPCTPASSSSKPSVSFAGASPPAPPLLLLSPEEISKLPKASRKAVKFAKAHRLVCDFYFPAWAKVTGRTKTNIPVIGQPELEALESFFEDEPNWGGLSLLLLQLHAWNRIGAKKENRNGSVYGYAACQSSEDIKHVLKHWERIKQDTNLPEVETLDAEQAIAGIRLELERQFCDDYSPEELGQKLVELEDKLVAVFTTVKPKQEEHEH
jgi:hypothetical protein